MKSKYRIGHTKRPDREWEIYNEEYSRNSETGARVQTLVKPWVAWHPKNFDAAPNFCYPRRSYCLCGQSTEGKDDEPG